MERGFCGCPACFGWRIFCAQVGAYFRVRLGSGGVARIRVFLFVMRWIIPLCLILTEFFPPFPERVPKRLCTETSYLRVQCLCGRADVWGARAVGATRFDVFGYGLPPENGIGSQWRYCCCAGVK